MEEDDDLGEHDPPSRLDVLRDVIRHLLPKRWQYGSVERLLLGADRPPGVRDLEVATAALADSLADPYVDAETALELLAAIHALRPSDVDADALRAQVIAHVERRWSSLCGSLAICALESHEPLSVFRWFPKLRHEPGLLNGLAAAIAARRVFTFRIISVLDEVAPSAPSEARLLTSALVERGQCRDKDDLALATSLFCALGRGMGWTPWVALQAIVCARPDYADVHASFEREGDRSRESEASIDRRVEMARQIEASTTVRHVAALVLEVAARGGQWRFGSVLDRPAEVRAAFVETLRATIGNDSRLRQATIEALLWCADGRAADLAQFAAVALSRPEDRPALLELAEHPVGVVRYAARAVRAAKFGDRMEVGTFSEGRGLVQSLVALDGQRTPTEEPASTWLGDRSVERLVEQTIARVEMRAAEEYDSHGDEGEDRLLASLFRELALRFEDLNQALEALARAASAPYRAAVNIVYRNVDRPEEGAKGIKDAERFSADLCLIVAPEIDGVSLGRRVTLVQAKRLYRNKKARKQPAWHGTFKIDPEQHRHLQKQTHSSVYFFHGPPLYGRGVPVIPTQLVADLANSQGSGTAVAQRIVGVASRSLAEWLTYDVLALRVGDPYEELVKRAAGSPGALPRPLLGVPTVEVEVALRTRSDERR